MQEWIAFAPIYSVERSDGSKGSVKLTLRGREVVLAESTYEKYKAVREALLRDPHSLQDISADLRRFTDKFAAAGLIKDVSGKPNAVSGAKFYKDVFEPALPFWLSSAFSHAFWTRMMEGRGSARLYLGWLIELYHYTKNANRHMPLAVAFCRDKRMKTMLAKHYQEEWNHFHFFERAIRAMEVNKDDLVKTLPLPMTLEMSNFMRQAARDDILAYGACSAVLEGTTVDSRSYGSFYDTMKDLYQVPDAAVRPIYEHLELDQEYAHANLYQEVCESVESIDGMRVANILDYGHQMVEHIWLWTDNIERYYGHATNPTFRTPFDLAAD